VPPLPRPCSAESGSPLLSEAKRGSHKLYNLLAIRRDASVAAKIRQGEKAGEGCTDDPFFSHRAAQTRSGNLRAPSPRRAHNKMFAGLGLFVVAGLYYETGSTTFCLFVPQFPFHTRLSLREESSVPFSSCTSGTMMAFERGTRMFTP